MPFANHNPATLLSRHGRTMALSRYIEHKPDIVLLDIELPGRDGNQICVDLHASLHITGSIPKYVACWAETPKLFCIVNTEWPGVNQHLHCEFGVE